MKPDINSREEIEQLVNAFYEAIRKDEQLGVIFDDVMHVNWEKHLPMMYAFWESVLFGAQTYKGNPMAAHIRVDQQVPLKPELFERWISLFQQVVDDNFEGKMAEEAKLRALSIARIKAFRLQVLRGETSAIKSPDR